MRQHSKMVSLQVTPTRSSVATRTNRSCNVAKSRSRNGSIRLNIVCCKLIFAFVSLNRLGLVLRVVPDAKQRRQERKQKHAHSSKGTGASLGLIIDTSNIERLGLNQYSDPELKNAKQNKRVSQLRLRWRDLNIGN